MMHLMCGRMKPLVSQIIFFNNCFVVLLLTTGCTTLITEEDLSGRYKVRGECAYRTDSGKYEWCIAWNTLTLQRENETPVYRFKLDTNTFATTQGGCYMEGQLIYKQSQLVPMGEQLDGCHFLFDVEADQFVLRVPESELYNSCKQSFCGHNSTLYSDPFPRNTKESADKPLYESGRKAKKWPNASPLPAVKP